MMAPGPEQTGKQQVQTDKSKVQTPEHKGEATQQTRQPGGADHRGKGLLAGEGGAEKAPEERTTGRAMTKKARRAANRGAAKVRREQGITDRDVQAGHTRTARHAPESGINTKDMNDPKSFQHLHSRKGKGLDVTVTDQREQTMTTSRHVTQDKLIDDAVNRARAADGGKLKPEAQVEQGEYVKWQTKNVPMDQRDVDAVRQSGPAKSSWSEKLARGEAGALEKLAKVGRVMGKFGRVLGIAGNIAGSAGEILDILAKEKPEWLPEGKRIPMTRYELPFAYDTGYTVERQGDRIIYRDSAGKEVTKEEVQRATRTRDEQQYL